jgi:hypothetical protein
VLVPLAPVPVLLPAGPQLIQSGGGHGEALLYLVITSRGNIQEELLKIWYGGDRFE